MSNEWDKEERKNDREQGIAPKVKLRSTDSPFYPGSGDLRNIPVWGRWGFPAGLTIGILIGLFLGFLSVWLIVLLFRMAP